MSTAGSIVYSRTPKSSASFAVLAVGFFLSGSWIVLVSAESWAELLTRAVGLVGFLCFGFCAWRLGRQQNRKHGVYAVNHDGFSLVGPDGKCALFVDWNEVQGVSATDMGYGKALSFAFRDPDTIKARMMPDQRARALENESVGLPTLTIPQSALDTPIDDIRTVSQRFFFGRA